MKLGDRINHLYKMRIVLGAQIRALRAAGRDADALDGHLTAVIKEHDILLKKLHTIEGPIEISHIEVGA